MNYYIYGKPSDEVWRYCEQFAIEKGAVNFYNWIHPNDGDTPHCNLKQLLTSHATFKAFEDRNKIFDQTINFFGYLAECYMVMNWFHNRKDCLEEKSQFIRDWSEYREDDPICFSKTWYIRDHLLLFEEPEHSKFIDDLPHEKIIL